MWYILVRSGNFEERSFKNVMYVHPEQIPVVWVGINVWAFLSAEWNTEVKPRANIRFVKKSVEESGSLFPIFRRHRSRLCNSPPYCLSSRSIHQDLYLEEYRAIVPYHCRRRCNSCSIPRSRNKTLNVRERRSAIYIYGKRNIRGGGHDTESAIERPRRAEKTSMLHLRGEYSRVTLHPWASEREGRETDGPMGVAHPRGGRGDGGWGRKGDTGSLLAAISSYAPAPIYPPALRISRHDSLRLSRSSTLRPLPATIPCYLISNKRQRFRDIPTTDTDVTLLVRFGWCKRKICDSSC